jgi:N-acetylglucosamine-6-phosphate deacetylase
MPATFQARHYRTGEDLVITCRDGRIEAVAPSPCHPVTLSPCHPITPQGEGLFVAPALFDLQINGCLGRNFTSETLTIDDVRAVADALHSHGVGGFCPTVVTSSHEVLRHSLRTLHAACRSDPELDRAMPCFHLEGPFISPEDGPRGAHPRQHVRLPSREEFDRLQDAAGGRIRLLTLAPELNGALELIEELTKEGVVMALGHTAASGERIRAAIRAGARLSTHLGNGSHALLPRHDNYVWEQAAADELWASLIADGHHLPPAVVRCLVRAKGAGRVILTCDASSLAGLPPGRYPVWGQEFEVRPGSDRGGSLRVVVPGTSYLAGSAAFTDTCVALVQRFAGVGLAEAIEMASARPRELLGLPIPTLEAGQPADLVFFRHGPGAEFEVTRASEALLDRGAASPQAGGRVFPADRERERKTQS